MKKFILPILILTFLVGCTSTPSRVEMEQKRECEEGRYVYYERIKGSDDSWQYKDSHEATGLCKENYEKQQELEQNMRDYVYGR